LRVPCAEAPPPNKPMHRHRPSYIKNGGPNRAACALPRKRERGIISLFCSLTAGAGHHCLRNRLRMMASASRMMREHQFGAGRDVVGSGPWDLAGRTRCPFVGIACMRRPSLAAGPPADEVRARPRTWRLPFSPFATTFCREDRVSWRRREGVAHGFRKDQFGFRVRRWRRSFPSPADGSGFPWCT